MTGEISLRGRVLPVGGLKEKVLAARRAGITRVVVPSDNAKDLADIPQDRLAGLEIHPVATVAEVLHLAFGDEVHHAS